MVRVGTPLVLIRLDMALVVIQVSLERVPNSEGSPTRKRLMTCTTLSTLLTRSSACCLSCSVGTSPTSSTRPAYELDLMRPGRSSSNRRVSLPALSSMALSSTCSPVVRRSTATTAVVVAAPPISTGAQALSRPRQTNKPAMRRTKRVCGCQDIRGVLRVIRYQYHHTWHARAQYEPLGCAWCDRGEHKDGCLCFSGYRLFYRRHCLSGR